MGDPKDIIAYLEQPEVKKAIEEVKNLKADKQWRISDVISETADGEIQWVDLVLAGGGMLGIALVGFTYVLEQAGIRFVGLGGTSAGAINAMLIAALRSDPSKACSEVLLSILATTDFISFLDGGDEAKKFTLEAVKLFQDSQTPAEGAEGQPERRGERGSLVDAVVGGVRGAFSLLVSPLKIVPGVGGVLRLLSDRRVQFLADHRGALTDAWRDRGLHTGNEFEKWLREQMGQVDSTERLTDRLQFSSIKAKKRQDASQPGEAPKSSSVKVVAADITTQSRAVFPMDKDQYWSATIRPPLHPARFVRASMSIPYFFTPMELIDIPNSGTSAVGPSWGQYEGNIPDKVTFIDGGIISNFPMDLYHDPKRVPLYPTFGVQLGSDLNAPQPTDNPISLFGSMFNSSRHALDRVYREENADKNSVITTIATTGFFWLDFNMPKAQREKLFARGAEAAAQFLTGFNWNRYKAIRQAQYDQQQQEAAIQRQFQ